MYIDSIQIDPPFFLAPMAGVTDRPFRILCKEMGAGFMYTEFVSSEGIVRYNDKTLDYLKFSESERPLGIQIFGSDADVMAGAAKIIARRFNPDVIDLNFGCPVAKVVKKGAGAALLKDVDYMAFMTEKVVAALDIPITIKMRSGWDAESVVAVEAGKKLESTGIKALTIHPRTVQMKYSGHSDWSIIKAMKEALTIPVIGNGDVYSAEDAGKMFKETGCAGIMIGRGSFGNPWIFKELTNYYLGKEDLPPVTVEEKFKIIHRHLDMLTEEVGRGHSFKLFKTHLSWYTSGMIESAHFRSLANRANSLVEMKIILNSFQEKQIL